MAMQHESDPFALHLELLGKESQKRREVTHVPLAGSEIPLGLGTLAPPQRIGRVLRQPERGRSERGDDCMLP